MYSSTYPASPVYCFSDIVSVVVVVILAESPSQVFLKTRNKISFPAMKHRLPVFNAPVHIFPYTFPFATVVHPSPKRSERLARQRRRPGSHAQAAPSPGVSHPASPHVGRVGTECADIHPGHRPPVDVDALAMKPHLARLANGQRLVEARKSLLTSQRPRSHTIES